MQIAGPRESSKFWTHIALLGYAQEHAYLSVPKPHSTTASVFIDTGGELDYDSARLCPALLKSISLL